MRHGDARGYDHEDYIIIFLVYIYMLLHIYAMMQGGYQTKSLAIKESS